jgi:hypothetical protein
MSNNKTDCFGILKLELWFGGNIQDSFPVKLVKLAIINIRGSLLTTRDAMTTNFMGIYANEFFAFELKLINRKIIIATWCGKCNCRRLSQRGWEWDCYHLIIVQFMIYNCSYVNEFDVGGSWREGWSWWRVGGMIWTVCRFCEARLMTLMINLQSSYSTRLSQYTNEDTEGSAS